MMMLTMMMILETWAEEDVDIDCVGEVGGGRRRKKPIVTILDALHGAENLAPCLS